MKQRPAHSFLPVYLAILLFALINRVINPFDKVSDGVSVTVEGFSFINMMRMASIVVYFALIVATIAMTFVIIIQRFYKNLLGDEGYLMFTLPVKPWAYCQQTPYILNVDCTELYRYRLFSVGPYKYR